MIGMDRSAFAYQTWRGPSPEMPLAHSPYETPRNYGFYFGPPFAQRPGVWVMDPWGRKLEGAPISETTRAELLRWERAASTPHVHRPKATPLLASSTPSRSKIT